MADDLFTPEDWIKRAKSNLIVATAFSIDNLPEDLFLEDLCFEIQQCAEKAIKAVLIYSGIDFSKTHDITELLKLIKNRTTISIPENIILSTKLTKYAVKTRYPHWNKISLEEYQQSVQIAKDILNWAKEIINTKN